jgi:hypothetical protein
VVRDDDAAHAAEDRLAGIIGREDALHDHRQARPRCDLAEDVPRERVAEGRSAVRRERRARTGGEQPMARRLGEVREAQMRR